MKIEIDEAKLKEIGEWYKNAKNTIFALEHLENYEPGDADYERGLRDGIEDAVKKLGLFELMQEYKKSEQSDCDELLEYMAQSEYEGERAMQKAYGGCYEIHD